MKWQLGLKNYYYLLLVLVMYLLVDIISYSVIYMHTIIVGGRSMTDILVVVDMQKDFVDGVLGTKEAVEIVPNVASTIREFSGKVFYTLDTHQ